MSDGRNGGAKPGDEGAASGILSPETLIRWIGRYRVDLESGNTFGSRRNDAEIAEVDVVLNALRALKERGAVDALPDRGRGSKAEGEDRPCPSAAPCLWPACTCDIADRFDDATFVERMARSRTEDWSPAETERFVDIATTLVREPAATDATDDAVLKPMESAPHDRRIVAWCDHEADPWSRDDGRSLTLYAAHAEASSHVGTGWHVLEWGGAWSDEGPEGSYGGLPDWWFLAGSGFEFAANPIGWLRDLPTAPKGPGIDDASSGPSASYEPRRAEIVTPGQARIRTLPEPTIRKRET